MLSDSSNCQTPKKQRLSEQCLPPPSPSHGGYGPSDCRGSSSHGNPVAQVKLDFDKTSNHVQESPSRLCLQHNGGGSSAPPKVERTEPGLTAPSSKIPHVEASVCADQQFNNGQHKKKRSKKHKDKERERLKPDWLETSPDLKQNQDKLRGWFSELRACWWVLFLYKWSTPTAFFALVRNCHLARREWFLCSRSLKQGVLRGLAFPPPVLTLICWWLTVQQLCDLRSSESAGCVSCCCAADVTACLGSHLLSEAAENKSISLDMNVTFYICTGNWLFIFFSVHVSSFLCADHEGEKTPVNQLSEEELPDYLM